MNFQSLKWCETTEEFHKSVCENFNTNLTQLDKDVQELREWLKTQPHLPQCASDTMLKTFLLGSKNKMEKAKTKLENYYIARAELPDIYSNRDSTSEKITENGEILHIYTLPKLTPDGCRVSMISFRTTDAKKLDINAYTKRTLMAEDIKMNMEPFVNGHYFVFDGKNLSMSHVIKFTPRIVRNLIYCGQNVLPIIIKGVFFINSPSYAEILLGLMKVFMKSKLFQRVHVHTAGPEVLEKYFPKALLPKDYGGEEETTSDTLSESWLECLRENRDWFLTEGQLKADIKVDVNKNKTALKDEEFQEMQGSFRTLCVD